MCLWGFKYLSHVVVAGLLHIETLTVLVTSMYVLLISDNVKIIILETVQGCLHANRGTLVHLWGSKHLGHSCFGHWPTTCRNIDCLDHYYALILNFKHYYL